MDALIYGFRRCSTNFMIVLESKITRCLSASTKLTSNWVCMALGTIGISPSPPLSFYEFDTY